MSRGFPDLSGLEAAIRLKSELLQTLVASEPIDWPRHVAQFVVRLDASGLEDTTALVVLLADLRAEIRLLTGERATSAGDLERWFQMDDDTELSRRELLSRFHDEIIASARPIVQVDAIRSPVARNAARFIDEHYGEAVTHRLLASVLGKSRRYVATLFRRETGRTLHAYLTDVRLRHALALIRQGEKIEAVSLMVGYRSKKNFYRHFKETIGVTPLAYKARVATLDAERSLTPPGQ